MGNLLFWGITLSVIGKIMIALAVILAHTQLAHEHKVDKKVIRSFKNERNITILGIILIVIGYIMEVVFLGGFNHMLTCEAAECAASLGSLL